MMFTGKNHFLLGWFSSSPLDPSWQWSGKGSVAAARKMIGATNPRQNQVRFAAILAVLVVTSSTAQMPLKPLVMKLAFGLRKKNLPAGSQA